MPASSQAHHSAVGSVVQSGLPSYEHCVIGSSPHAWPSRGENASPEQWAIYLVCALGLAAALWLAAIWRYRQEKLAISV